MTAGPGDPALAGVLRRLPAVADHVLVVARPDDDVEALARPGRRVHRLGVGGSRA